MRWYARIGPVRLLLSDVRYVTTQFFPIGARETVVSITNIKLWYATEFCRELIKGSYVLEDEKNAQSHLFACELLRGVAVLLYAEGSRRKAFVLRSSAQDGLDLSQFKVYAARRTLCYGVSACRPAPRTWRQIANALRRAYPGLFASVSV